MNVNLGGLSMRTLLALFILALPAFCQPPTLTVAKEVLIPACKSSEIPLTTDAFSVIWISQDPAVEFFDRTKLKDPKTAWVTVKTPGRYTVIVVAASAKGEQSWASITLIVGNVGPQPPPTPPVPPEPKPPEPPVPPTPVANQQLVVIVIEESANAAQERAKFFNDAALSAKIEQKKHKVYAVDKDVVGPDGRPPASLVGYLNEAAGKKLPWIVIADMKGVKMFSGPTPLDAASVLKLLVEYGG